MKVIREFLLALAVLATATAIAHASSIATTSQEQAVTTAPDRTEAHRRPLACSQFLEVRSVKTSEWLVWAKRLSLAACEQARVAVPAVTSTAQLRDTVAQLDASAQTSIALYKDALAHGPDQIKMLAAYGLGMAYVNIMVQARSAIRPSANPMLDLAAANQYLCLHHALEPLLASYAKSAAAAFGEADRLAARSPAHASANAVMRNVIATARTGLHEQTASCPIHRA